MSIVPETAKYAEVPFRVLTDLDLAYALSLGLVFWVRDKIKETYRQFGIDLARFSAMAAGCCRSRRRSWSARTAA